MLCNINQVESVTSSPLPLSFSLLNENLPIYDNVSYDERQFAALGPIWSREVVQRVNFRAVGIEKQAVRRV